MSCLVTSDRDHDGNKCSHFAMFFLYPLDLSFIPNKSIQSIYIYTYIYIYIYSGNPDRRRLRFPKETH